MQTKIKYFFAIITTILSIIAIVIAVLGLFLNLDSCETGIKDNIYKNCTYDFEFNTLGDDWILYDSNHNGFTEKGAKNFLNLADFYIGLDYPAKDRCNGNCVDAFIYILVLEDSSSNDSMLRNTAINTVIINDPDSDFNNFQIYPNVNSSCTNNVIMNNNLNFIFYACNFTDEIHDEIEFEINKVRKSFKYK